MGTGYVVHKSKSRILAWKRLGRSFIYCGRLLALKAVAPCHNRKLDGGSVRLLINMPMLIAEVI
jgi:hypothetical protein